MNTNNLFYSDAELIEIDPHFINQLPHSTFTIEDYKGKLQKHLKELETTLEEHKDLNAVYLECTYVPAPEKKKLRLFLHGQKPWSQERIDEFEAVVKEEKDDITTLRSLMTKYPEKAKSILLTILRDQISEPDAKV